MFSWIFQSRLIELAQGAGRKPHVLLVIFLGFAMALLSQFGAIPVVIAQVLMYGIGTDDMPAYPQDATLSGLWMGLILVTGFVGIFLFTWLWAWLFEKRRFATLGFELANAPLRYLRGFALGLGMFGISVLLMLPFGFVVTEQGDPAMQGLAALGGVLLVLPGWLVQGAGEELLTRGWMMPILSARYKPWLGIVISSLFFAILHGLNPNLSLIALLNLALFGFFAAFYALREGSLWGICALHSAWNWVQGNVLGFKVSGNAFGGGMLLNLAENGPDWFTGGAFGPEGGLAVTIVLGIGIAALFAWPQPAKPAV